MGFDNYKKGFVYILSDFGISKIKIGITNRKDINRRIKEIQRTVDFKVVELIHYEFKSGYIAWQVEQKALNQYSNKLNLRDKTGRRLTEWVEYDIKIFEFIKNAHLITGDFKPMKRNEYDS